MEGYNSYLGDFESYYTENKGLVYSAIHRVLPNYHNLSKEDREDFEQVALIGFYIGYLNFDPTKNGSAGHVTFVYGNVFNRLRKKVRDDTGIIRYPRRFLKFQKFISFYGIEKFDDFAKYEDELKKWDIPQSTLSMYWSIRTSYGLISLDVPVSEDNNESETRLDMLVSKPSFHTSVDDYIRSLFEVKILNARECEVLVLKAKGYTRVEIADKLGLSQKYISVVLKRVRTRLKRFEEEYG